MAAFGATPVMYRKSRQTGTLNLAGFDLKEIPAEILSPFDHLDEGESSQYVVLLNRLNLQVSWPPIITPTFGEVTPRHDFLSRANDITQS